MHGGRKCRNRGNAAIVPTASRGQVGGPAASTAQLWGKYPAQKGCRVGASEHPLPAMLRVGQATSLTGQWLVKAEVVTCVPCNLMLRVRTFFCYTLYGGLIAGPGPLVPFLLLRGARLSAVPEGAGGSECLLCGSPGWRTCGRSRDSGRSGTKGAAADIVMNRPAGQPASALRRRARGASSRPGERPQGGAWRGTGFGRSSPRPRDNQRWRGPRVDRPTGGAENSSRRDPGRPKPLTTGDKTGCLARQAPEGLDIAHAMSSSAGAATTAALERRPLHRRGGERPGPSGTLRLIVWRAKSFQSPSARGQPDAPGGLSSQPKCSQWMICTANTRASPSAASGVTDPASPR